MHHPKPYHMPTISVSVSGPQLHRPKKCGPKFRSGIFAGIFLAPILYTQCCGHMVPIGVVQHKKSPQIPVEMLVPKFW